jgi:hypothetical protein
MKNLIIVFALILTASNLFAQSSVTRDKKSNHYPFFQVNTSLNYNKEAGLKLANENPANQLSVAYGYKNLAAMQRGIIKSVALDQVKVGLSLVYLPPLSKSIVNPLTGDSSTVSTSKFNLAINTVEIKLKTKFDRTSIKLGYFGLPYGYSPKISSDYSLIPGLAGNDLKFSKDVGVQVDLPVLESLDVSAALTMGGLLSAPLMNFSFVDDGLVSYGLYSPTNYQYDGNWLFTATAKKPNFSKKSMGVSTTFGKLITSLNGVRADANVFRVAPYISIKNNEFSVFTNQLSLGFTNYEFARTQSVSLITQYEQLLGGWASFYVANQFKYFNDRGVAETTDRIIAGINLFPTPLMTIRLNVSYKTNLGSGNEFDINDASSFFQIIYGFGRKL